MSMECDSICGVHRWHDFVPYKTMFRKKIRYKCSRPGCGEQLNEENYRLWYEHKVYTRDLLDWSNRI